MPGIYFPACYPNSPLHTSDVVSAVEHNQVAKAVEQMELLNTMNENFSKGNVNESIDKFGSSFFPPFMSLLGGVQSIVRRRSNRGSQYMHPPPTEAAGELNGIVPSLETSTPPCDSDVTVRGFQTQQSVVDCATSSVVFIDDGEVNNSFSEDESIVQTPPLHHQLFPCNLRLSRPSPPIGLQSFDISHLFGYGSQGSVYLAKARHSDSDQLLAVKRIRKKHFMPNVTLQLLLNEQTILRRLRGHPLLLNLVASFHDTNNFYLVTEFHYGGDLQEEIEECGVFSINRVRFCAAELVSAVLHIHKQGIIHRDLKPSNILISEEGHIVIADFGLATFQGAQPRISSMDFDLGALHSDYQTITWCGTPEFMAPEVHQRKLYDHNVDIWAIGIIMFTMIEGKIPYNCKFQLMPAMINDIINAPLPWKSPAHVDPYARQLTESLTAKWPEDRPDSKMICRHPFFALVDWMEVQRGVLRVPFTPINREPCLAPSDMLMHEGAPYTIDPHPEYYFAHPDLEDAEFFNVPIDRDTEDISEPKWVSNISPGLEEDFSRSDRYPWSPSSTSGEVRCPTPPSVIVDAICTFTSWFNYTKDSPPMR